MVTTLSLRRALFDRQLRIPDDGCRFSSGSTARRSQSLSPRLTARAGREARRPMKKSDHSAEAVATVSVMAKGGHPLGDSHRATFHHQPTLSTVLGKLRRMSIAKAGFLSSAGYCQPLNRLAGAAFVLGPIDFATVGTSRPC